MRGASEETVAWRYFSRDVLPFAAMFTVECTTVGSTTLYKAASLRGLSFYVFVFYSYLVSTLLLLPLSLIFGRYLISSSSLLPRMLFSRNIKLLFNMQVKKIASSQVSSVLQDFHTWASWVILHSCVLIKGHFWFLICMEQVHVADSWL